MYRSNVHLFWLTLVFIVVDRLADSDKQEEHDGYDDIEGIEIFVERENSEVVKIPEQMKDDHEKDSKSSEDVQFDESLWLSLFFLWFWIGIHVVFFSLSLLVIDIM